MGLLLGGDALDLNIDILIVSDFYEKIDVEVAWIIHDKNELISAHIMSRWIQ